MLSSEASVAIPSRIDSRQQKQALANRRHDRQHSPLVTRQALQAFTQRLVKHFAPKQVILFGSQARGEARWDSDADILVVMPFEGRPQDTAPRYRWGDPFIREALNHAWRPISAPP